ncbi:hypothetical protein Clacol_009483 [Clathrus columnatus]|uniref:Glucose-methanol-choline oxidoreductase N-terminal domain-containing protein n=1 Tax=Clathrus columnatus TaxID=1419009 RepID=A0AAV5AN84_9AGAM|nr:hypothetical protein Clacol_009483 [Clathrus columnatus]
MELVFANIEDVTNHTFDYVIVGGGVAGSVIAGRLSEKSDTIVLLLEAGKGRINDPLIVEYNAADTPSGGARGYQFGDPEYLRVNNCRCLKIPQKNLNGRKMIWNRGKGLGGSSNINQMAWTRPGRIELDAWEKLGNPGWSYEDIIPYIQKVENFHPLSDETIKAKVLAPEQHWFGRNGPISLAFCEVLTGLDDTIRKTITGLGIPAINNAPLGEYTGLWNCPSTVDPVKLERSTAFKGYIQPHLNRKNLFVLPEAYATKLIWKNDSKPNENGEFSAEGVEFIFGGRTFMARSAKEVLLTAGALKSPQLLELSGIGRPDVLNPLDIPVLVDLPGVGENLQDHYCANAIVFGTLSPMSREKHKTHENFVCLELHPNAAYRTIDLLRDPVEYEKYEELYKKKQHGLLSFTNSDSISPNAEELIELHVKDLANRIANTNTNTLKGLKGQLDLQLERLRDPRLPTVELITAAQFLDHPNPLDPPKLDANALEYPFELDLLTEEFKFARKLRDCEPLKGIIAKEIAPGDKVVTDEQIRGTHLEQCGVSSFSPPVCVSSPTYTDMGCLDTSGTLSMLPREKNGVVDPSLKASLFVYFKHIQKIIIAGLAYAIAEKAADIILGRA